MPARLSSRLLIPLALQNYHPDSNGARDKTKLTSLLHVEVRRDALEGPCWEVGRAGTPRVSGDVLQRQPHVPPAQGE